LKYNEILALGLFAWLIYRDDYRSYLKSEFSAEIEQIYNRLVKDYEAIAILSTHAVNFFYFYKEYLLGERFDISSVCKQVENYFAGTKMDKQKILLELYFYTHIIINESAFYSKPICSHIKPLLLKLLKKSEGIIRQNYFEINLDNKFEFLVCAEILKYRTSLCERILAEAEKSIAEGQDYLVDYFNTNPQLERTNINSSEHRNVLFVMSQIDHGEY